MTEQRNGPKTGQYRTMTTGYLGPSKPTSAPARPDARSQASAKPAKPTMTDEQIDAAVKAGMKRNEKPHAGQASAADALTRIRLTERALLAQVAGCDPSEVDQLKHG